MFFVRLGSNRIPSVNGVDVKVQFILSHSHFSVHSNEDDLTLTLDLKIIIGNNGSTKLFGNIEYDLILQFL